LEAANKFLKCNGQETGILALLPVVVKAYTDCGGTSQLPGTDYVSLYYNPNQDPF